MPPKFKFSREELIAAALDIVRKGGIQAVTARAVAARLKASPKVIFGLFKNMDELLTGVMGAAQALYESFLEEDMTSGKYPAYKGSGMAYIRFARDEKELFKLLFMRDRTGEKNVGGDEAIKPLVALIQNRTGLCQEDAYMFHLEMWVYVHGIASMIASGYLQWDRELTERMLTDAYEGILGKYLS